MQDIYTVYKGVLFEDSIRNDIDKENVSVCRLLHFLNIDNIAQHVEITIIPIKTGISDIVFLL